MKLRWAFPIALAACLAMVAPARANDDSPNAGNKKVASTSTPAPSARLPLGRLTLFPAAATPAAKSKGKTLFEDGGLGKATPKVDIAGTYDYVRFRPGHGINDINANGGGGDVAFNVSKYLGLVADFGFYHTSGRRLTAGTAPAAVSIGSASANTVSYLFGPRLNFRNWDRVVPFAQVLFGGARISSSGSSINSFAMTMGGGFDLIATPHIGIRLIQGEYLLTHFLNEQQNNFRLASGIVFRLGLPTVPPSPPSVTCSASPSSMVEGSNGTVEISTTASDPQGDQLTYNWSASAGKLDGSGPTARWDSTGLGPGSYTITVKVTNTHGLSSSCDSTVTITPKPAPPPPSMTCSVDRSSVLVGERSNVTATVNDQTGTPLSYTWQANGGQIVGTGANVQFDSTGAAPGTYTITGRVQNGVGGAADCSTSVTVQAPPPPPQASKINECSFRPGSARVDNVCKRVLDDVALRLQNDAKAKVVLVGYADPAERKPDKLAAERAENAKKYLATKSGVDASRVDTRGAAGQKGAGKENRRVDIVWVPEGATY